MIAPAETRQESKVTDRIKKQIELNCKQCGHLRVCVVYRGILSLLTKHFTEDTQPFEAGNLANICGAYVSAIVLARLKVEKNDLS